MNKRIWLIFPILCLACGLSSRLPVPENKIPPAGSFASPTTQNIGQVSPGVTVNIRNTPEANGSESWIIGQLHEWEQVEQIGKCAYVGDFVWVHHANGWSVARNSSTTYIAGVC